MILKIGVENNRDYPRLFASRPKIGGLRNGGNIHAINNTITTCLPINASRLHPSHAPWQPNTSCGAHGAPSPPGCAWAWMCQGSIVFHTVPGAPKKWGPEKVCGGNFYIYKAQVSPLTHLQHPTCDLHRNTIHRPAYRTLSPDTWANRRLSRRIISIMETSPAMANQHTCNPPTLALIARVRETRGGTETGHNRHGHAPVDVVIFGCLWMFLRNGDYLCSIAAVKSNMCMINLRRHGRGHRPPDLPRHLRLRDPA